MLSYPDFSEKQLLCIGSKYVHDIRFANDNLVIERDGKIVEQASCHKLFAVFLIGEATITTHLVRKLESYGIAFVCLRDNFSSYAVFGGLSEGNTVLRAKQYEKRTDVDFARKIVENKIENHRALLRKLRNRDAIADATIERLERLKNEVRTCDAEEGVLGNEGLAARYFFGTYFRECGWSGRSPRTRKNVPNLLLDIGYTFLFHFVEAMLRTYGFDVYKGFYHTEFYQRKSLVCDVMEPFRPIVDHALWRAYRLKRIDEKDFRLVQGEYVLDPAVRNKYASIFFREILDEKEAIYRYVRFLYWRYVGHREEFPFYSYETHACSSFPTT